MITEITAKSILRRYRKIDSWFITRYGINLYRGCLHNCAYCDGRAEKYQVEGSFGTDLQVKTNALEILEREIDPARRRVPLSGGYMTLGGGVADSYQGVEKKYELARGALRLFDAFEYPVHVLTKSTLVERDIDLLKSINEKSGALVSFSFSSVDEGISAVFEPGVPSPRRRLEAISRFREAGIPCGMFLMPVIPLVSDAKEMIFESVRAAVEAGVDFIIFGTMTLKPGRQKDHFLSVLKTRDERLVDRYEKIYHTAGSHGGADHRYVDVIHRRFREAAAHYGIPVRIPPALFSGMLNRNDRVIVILEQLDYLLKLAGKESPYGYAAYALSKAGENIEGLSLDELKKFRGIGPVTAGIVREIMETGRCRYHEKLLSARL